MTEFGPQPFHGEQAITGAAKEAAERLGRVARLVSEAAVWLGRGALGLLCVSLFSAAVTWLLVAFGFRDRPS